MDTSALARRRFSSAILAAWILAAVPAAAQDRDAPHVGLGAAVGVATPLHGDLDFTAGSWQADVRFDTARHFGFSVFFDEWRETEEQLRTDQAILGPVAVLGRADRVTTRTAHRTRALGWSLLARATAARVTLGGGGGVSYLVYSRDFTQTMSGCVPETVCRDFSQRFDNGRFAAQAQVGADVAVAPHVAVTGQFRFLVPVQDPAGGYSAYTAGVRYVF
jgi:hypothetical protein